MNIRQKIRMSNLEVNPRREYRKGNNNHSIRVNELLSPCVAIRNFVGRLHTHRYVDS